MHICTVYAKVTHVANAINSKEGNPIKRVKMVDPGGMEYEFMVEPDSQMNYTIGNSEYRDNYHTFYVNRQGRIGSRAGE